ncbi:MAG: hypothetical protein ACOZNI_28645 [Myxococcota bacterium]
MSKRGEREAAELAKAGRWAEAAEAWQALAEKAARVQDKRVARELAALAADAFRRDDRPAASAKMLRLAAANGRAEVSDAVQLAAVLQDAGQVEAAWDIARTAYDGAKDDVGRTLAGDTLAGLALTRGDLEEARARVDALAAIGLPGGEMSATFRRAQIDRLDGLGASAEAAWTKLAEQLAPHPTLSGPEGACWQELGELDLLRAAFGAPVLARAEERFARAAASWTRAGRRAGLFRAEAWGLRARALAGDAVAAPSVDRAIAFARERGMPLLEADLRACRAVIARDADELLHTLDLCAETPLARGRARVLRAELGGPADLELARQELAVDGPWRARALRAIGRARGDERLVAEAEEAGRGLA